MALVHTIVEGLMDEAMANRILIDAGHTPGPCYGKKGFTYIRDKIGNFNQTASTINYFAMVDFMDTGFSCPGEVVTTWLPHRQPKMLLRVVVRELESWLLADRENMADFLQIAISKIPANPENLKDPKLTLVNLARHSRGKQIREALVPETGSTASVGRLYTSEIIRFISIKWDISQARQNAPSLDRCWSRLKLWAE